MTFVMVIQFFFSVMTDSIELSALLFGFKFLSIRTYPIDKLIQNDQSRYVLLILSVTIGDM